MDRVIEKKKWYQKKKVWLLAAAVIVLVALYISFLADSGSKLNVDIEKVTVDTVQYSHFQDYMATIGTVTPIRTVYLDATEGGRVEEIILEEGSMVTEGDVIMRLSNPNLNLSILQSEANLAEQMNFLRNTRVTMEQHRLELKQQILQKQYEVIRLKREFENKQQFFDNDLVSEEDYLVAKENYEYAAATLDLLLEQQKTDSVYRNIQVEQMEHSLLMMEENLSLVRQKQENLIIKAPVTGQLGMLNADIGEQKSQGERLGLINVLTSYKVQAEIDEYFIRRVTPGLIANFEVDGQNYTLQVKKVYPEVRNGRFQIDMIFPEEMPETIRSGQTFRLKLELGESKEANLIARGGFYQSTGGQWVYVIDPSGEFAVKREIKIGRQNPRYYEVIDGLQAGERVIVSSYDNFGDVDKLIF